MDLLPPDTTQPNMMIWYKICWIKW